VVTQPFQERGHIMFGTQLNVKNLTDLGHTDKRRGLCHDLGGFVNRDSASTSLARQGAQFDFCPGTVSPL
jgi:hypothetical protein